MTEPFKPFELSDGERRNQLWLKLKAHFEESLRVLRCKNDELLSADETAAIRGQIKCLRGIIRLGDDPPLTDQ